MITYMLSAPETIQPLETEKPVPAGREVLVRVKYVGICGSDIHLYRGTYSAPHSYPLRFGHEWSGVVEAVGPEVTRVSVGDVVTGDCSRYCGKCPACARDRNLCESIEKFGITIDGASAEYILRDEAYLYRGPEGVDLKHLCLSEPVAVAAHLAIVEPVHLLKADESVFHVAHHHAARRGPDVHRRIAVGSRFLRLLRHSRPISELISQLSPGEIPVRK